MIVDYALWVADLKNIKWDPLIFWQRVKQTRIAKSETLFIQELEPAFNVKVGSKKLMLN